MLQFPNDFFYEMPLLYNDIQWRTQSVSFITYRLSCSCFILFLNEYLCVYLLAISTNGEVCVCISMNLEEALDNLRYGHL